MKFEENLGKEQQNIETKKEVPLDENVFGVLDSAIIATKDKERRRVGGAVALTIKLDAFKDAERQLDNLNETSISSTGIVSENSDHRIDFQRDVEHKIASDVATLTSVLQHLGLRPRWLSEDQRKVRLLMEGASLRYALGIAHEYQEMALATGEKDSKEFFKQKRLDGVLDDAFMKEHIVNKIEALPPAIRDNLFKIYK